MRSVSRAGGFLWVVLTALMIAAPVHPSGMEIPLTDATWSFEGTQSEEYIGYSLNYAGDLNGDDYMDVVVGAPYHDDDSVSGQDHGRAWVFYGSATGPAVTPDVTLTPPHFRTGGLDSFANVASWAGDVNNDDYDDLMVSMVNYSLDLDQRGAVFVYYGSDTGISTTHDWMAQGDVSGLHFGWGAGPAGDVNGDNIDDIIVGSQVGAYVFYGSDNGLDPDGSRPIGLPGNADWQASHNNPGEYFGFHVGSTGDVNDDGYDDIWVAAPFYDNPEHYEGKVFVWYSSPTGLGDPGTPANADWAVESNQVEARMGGDWLIPAVSGVGDVNGDGFDDFIVGVGKYDTVALNEGIALLYFGSANGLDPDGSRPLGTPDNADWRLDGMNEGDLLGYTTPWAGDLNQDAIDDLLIGVYSYDVPGAAGAGMMQVWMGSSSGPISTPLASHVDCFVKGDQTGGVLGAAIGSLGDVDGDGNNDLITTALYWDDPGVLTNTGKVYLFSFPQLIFAEDFESGDLWRMDRVVP